MTDNDLPRGVARHYPADGHLVWIDPIGVADAVGPVTDHADGTVEFRQHVLDRRRYLATARSEQVDVGAGGIAIDLTGLYGIVRRTALDARRAVARGLRREEYVTEPGVEPEYRVEVQVTVHAVVPAWPAVKGVTVEDGGA